MTRPAPKIWPPRIALSIPEAAASLGFGESYFRKNILSQLPVIQSTRPRILVSDLVEWAETHRTFPEVPRSRLVDTFALSRGSKLDPETEALAQRLLERASRSTQRRSAEATESEAHAKRLLEKAARSKAAREKGTT